MSIIVCFLKCAVVHYFTHKSTEVELVLCVRFVESCMSVYQSDTSSDSFKAHTTYLLVLVSTVSPLTLSGLGSQVWEPTFQTQ